MTYESDGVGQLAVGGHRPRRPHQPGWAHWSPCWRTNLAFEHGASSCTLQASPMGAPLYLGLGYETIYHYAEFVRWPKAPAG